MQLLAKMQYAHHADRDACYVLYDKTDNREGAIEEFVVWTESSTGDRYWGHYFPYNTPEQKEQAYWDAHKCFIRLAARKYNVPLAEESEIVY